nr:hypothetical protein BaRGS_012279 [Batillaria attramentaria]
MNGIMSNTVVEDTGSEAETEAPPGDKGDGLGKGLTSVQTESGGNGDGRDRGRDLGVRVMFPTCRKRLGLEVDKGKDERRPAGHTFCDQLGDWQVIMKCC